MVKASQLKEGTKVNYQFRVHCGTGKVVQKYPTPNGIRVVIHDKARNKSVTAFLSQISLWKKAVAS